MGTKTIYMIRNDQGEYLTGRSIGTMRWGSFRDARVYTRYNDASLSKNRWLVLTRQSDESATIVIYDLKERP